MKKILAVLLALIMVCGTFVIASAEGEDPIGITDPETGVTTYDLGTDASLFPNGTILKPGDLIIVTYKPPKKAARALNTVIFMNGGEFGAYEGTENNVVVYPESSYQSYRMGEDLEDSGDIILPSNEIVIPNIGDAAVGYTMQDGGETIVNVDTTVDFAIEHCVFAGWKAELTMVGTSSYELKLTAVWEEDAENPFPAIKKTFSQYWEEFKAWVVDQVMTLVGKIAAVVLPILEKIGILSVA